MTNAHRCLPLGVSLEASVEESARVPAATAAPTAVSFKNSRRFTFCLLIFVLAILFYSAPVPAFQPGSQYHSTGQANETCECRKSEWTNRLRLRGNRGEE